MSFIHTSLSVLSPTSNRGLLSRLLLLVIINESYLVIEEVEQVLDGKWQSGTPVRRTEDRLEEIVDKFLKCAFRGQQPG